MAEPFRRAPSAGCPFANLLTDKATDYSRSRGVAMIERWPHLLKSRNRGNGVKGVR